MTNADMPASSIIGVGKIKSGALAKLNIHTVEDLLRHFPKGYEDRRRVSDIARLKANEPAQIKARVISVESPSAHGGFYKGRQPHKLLVGDGSGTLEILFFNASYLRNAFGKDDEFIFYGKVSVGRFSPQMVNPEFSRASDSYAGRVLPVYPLCAGLNQRDLRKWVEDRLNFLQEPEFVLDEFLPESTLSRNKLCGIRHAMRNIHFPTNKRCYQEARYRLIFEELLVLHTGLSLSRGATRKTPRLPPGSAVDMAPFFAALPFRPTPAQRRVINEALSDMSSPTPMNRLIQGDVGSGKTLVAAALMYATVKRGFQAVIMAPTETLARQHSEYLRPLLEPLGVSVGFLAGDLNASERKTVLTRLEHGEIDVLTGTHAVIQPSARYKNLGLVVTDEQHRFGVRQRVGLANKGTRPDALVMTATPIPRTLALIVYGDLDVSVIDEKPPGRQKTLTTVIPAKKRKEAHALILREAKNGRQAYIIAPQIDDIGPSDLKSVKALYSELSESLRGLRLGLLHGQMPTQEKDMVMGAFYSHDIDVLISTTLVEVGVNVPDATVIMIENAERFGLAQLHQLRGRVGRGSGKSYCVLVTDSGSDETAKRMNVLASTDDGFLIAEKDLEIRGPGEFFGTKQHGVPPLKVASLIKHTGILRAVREESAKLLKDDPELLKIQNRPLKEKILAFFDASDAISL